MSIRTPVFGIIVFIILMFSAREVFSQDLIKKGTLEIVDGDVTDDYNGSPIVPPLDDDEGMIRISIENNVYFSTDDVVEWLKSNRMQIQGLKYDVSGNIKRPDGSIVLRYNFRFLTNNPVVSRRIQIRLDEYNLYFETKRFHQKKLTNLTLKIAEPPQYSVQNGTLSISLNERGTQVFVLDEEGNQVESELVAGTKIDFELEIGKYQVLVNKAGFEEFQSQIVEVSFNQTSTIQATLEEQREKSMFLVVNVRDEDGGRLNDFDIKLQDQNTLQTVRDFPAIQSGQRLPIPIGDFNIIVEKAGYKSDRKPMVSTSLSEGETVNLSFRLESDVQTQPVTVSTSSSTSIKPKKRKTGLWFLMLLAAGGGAAYYVTQSGGSSGGGYGSPPALPTN